MIFGITEGRSGFVMVLRGDKQLIAKLDRLVNKDAKAAIRKGTRAGAKILRPAARRLAPPVKRSRRRSPKDRSTGALRRNIKIKALKRSRHYAGVKLTVAKGFFTGDTFYAGFQEFGWHAGKQTGYSKSHRSAAVSARGRTFQGRRWVEGIHFMERAAETHGPAALARATHIIAKEIEILAKR